MSRRAGATDEWAEVIGAARAASRRAYAPYSHLRVGAALMGVASKVYVGCNVENSSFGLTLCAERAAVCAAISAGDHGWSRLVIYTPDGGPLSPCGACRQVLAEFCRALPILSVGRGGVRRELNLRELLPQPFAWPAGNRAGDPEAADAGDHSASG